MNIIIRPIESEDYSLAHAFQCEYLDQESFGQFTMRVQAHPSLYLVALDGVELAGICYGGRSRMNHSGVHLHGIAVNLDEQKQYARQGIGSRLIGQFESVVHSEGFHTIGIGAADDEKVERFYLKNSYAPIELVAKNEQNEELERLPITGYASGKHEQKRLRAKHRAKEVIFIFEKSL